jgi:hypothetical protein
MVLALQFHNLMSPGERSLTITFFDQGRSADPASVASRPLPPHEAFLTG